MYNPSTSVRVVIFAAVLGISDIPALTAPDLQSVVGIAVFVAGLVVFAFLVAVVVLTARIYFLRVLRPPIPEAEPVWLKTFDNDRTPDADAP